MPEVFIRRVTEDGAEPVDTVLDDDALTQFVTTHPAYIQVRDESVGRRRELTKLKAQLRSTKDVEDDDDDEESAPPAKKDKTIDPDKLVELAAQRVLAQVEQQTKKATEVAGLMSKYNLPADLADIVAQAPDSAALAARLSKLTAKTGEFDPDKKDTAPEAIMAKVMSRLKLAPDKDEDKDS
jgi:hypothetical protein